MERRGRGVRRERKERREVRKEEGRRRRGSRGEMRRRRRGGNPSKKGYKTRSLRKEQSGDSQP